MCSIILHCLTITDSLHLLLFSIFDRDARAAGKFSRINFNLQQVVKDGICLH